MLKNYTSILVLLLFIIACKHKEEVTPATTVTDNYPDAIKKILVGKCATAGCHNAASYKGAGSLQLDSWDNLFKGSSNGAVVIPYSPDNSSLLYFVNNNPDLGTTALPLMPYNAEPLSEAEYKTLRDWVANGAPDKNGNIPFAENTATKQKIYMAQYGCDLVAVIDAERNLVMRYIPVGKTYDTENPNNIIMSPNGSYAYVSFWNTNLIQKIDTRIDSVVAEVVMPRAFIKAMQVSKDGATLIACNWYTHELTTVDANTMTIKGSYNTPIKFVGGFEATDDGRFITTSQFGNTMYKVAVDGTYETYTLDGKAATSTSNATTPDPYRVMMSKDGAKYFVTCTNTDEVAVMDAATNTLIKAIPVGHNPQEMVLSQSLSNPYLFVSCMNDTVSKLEVGSVYVIDYNSFEVVKVLRGKFFQPNALALDDTKELLYIFNRNEDKNGPPPHHSSPCDGRNGFYQVFDINTLEPHTGVRFEVTVDPYAAAARY